jgi:hypothetical protein
MEADANTSGSTTPTEPPSHHQRPTTTTAAQNQIARPEHTRQQSRLGSVRNEHYHAHLICMDDISSKRNGKRPYRPM